MCDLRIQNKGFVVIRTVVSFSVNINVTIQLVFLLKILPKETYLESVFTSQSKMKDQAFPVWFLWALIIYFTTA